VAAVEQARTPFSTAKKQSTEERGERLEMEETGRAKRDDVPQH